MTVYKIKSSAIEGRFETCDRDSAQRKLTEVRKKDPSARLLAIPASR